MTVKQLRAFLAVAQSLSFAQAGERLHLSQPALSLAIKSLEESLGGPLLERTTRSVSLTPEGETLLPLALRLLADWDNTEELLRQHFTLQLGKVSIAAMPSFAGNLLPLVLKTFRERHPRVNVAVHDVINEQVLEMVRNRRVELGIAFEPESLENLEFTPFYSDRFVAVVPTGSPLSGQERISWRELLGEPFITLRRCACSWKRGRRARSLAGGVREPPTGHGRADGRPGTRCQRRADPVHPADAGTRRALPAARAQVQRRSACCG
ncbi:Hca operon transcriptional activator HcaR [Pseudomonas aeruginosa]|nr:Hca operon transcriptional activator HcaR [Pseudomonas aeruginosa]